MLILYGLDISPPYRSVLMIGNVLGLQFEEKNINLLNGDHLKPEYMKMNPQHTVPTLDDDGFIVWDSHAIGTYLVNKYGKDDTLYPTDSQQRAIIDQRLHFDSGILFPRMRAVFYPILFLGKKEIPEEKKKDILEAYAFLEAFLGNNKWMAGDNITVADICLISGISSVDIVIPVQKETFPKLKVWFDMCKDLPLYKEVNSPGLENFKSMVKKCLE